MTGAIIVSGLVGAGASIYSANKASDAADSAAERQNEAVAAQLAFNQKQYADWQSIFGPIEKNLANYYNKLTPDTYAAHGVQNVQAEYQNSLQRVSQNLAQRGIDVSGIMAQNELSMAQQAANQKAQVRMDAPQAVANAKANFLQVGENLKSGLQGKVAGSFGNVANLANEQWKLANNQADQAYVALANVAGSSLNAYMKYQGVQDKSQKVIPVNSGLPTV